jgi:hypothetical protein
MFRKYMVRLSDPLGNFRDMEVSGNTQTSASKRAMATLEKLLGKERAQKWVVSRVTFVGPPQKYGRSEA